MEQERRRAPAQGIRAIFASLRVQIIVLLVLCYLIPVLVLSVFIQSTLLPGMRGKTASVLAADVEHA